MSKITTLKNVLVMKWIAQIERTGNGKEKEEKKER